MECLAKRLNSGSIVNNSIILKIRRDYPDQFKTLEPNDAGRADLDAVHQRGDRGLGGRVVAVTSRTQLEYASNPSRTAFFPLPAGPAITTTCLNFFSISASYMKLLDLVPFLL